MPDAREGDPRDQSAQARSVLRQIAELRELRAQRLQSLSNIDTKLAFLEREYAELVGDKRSEPQPLAASTKPGYGSVRNAILERLLEAEDGLTSGQIARILRTRIGSEFHPKSHLQALKRLGADGLAIKTANIWRLTDSGADAAIRLRTWE